MKNWKTTLCGVALAAIVAVQNYNGQNNWQGYLGAVLIAAIGALSKDFNVTGA
jgi:hypothetical protein